MKTLGELIINNSLSAEEKNIRIDRLSAHSSSCTENSLFFCINGTKINGEEFAYEAVRNGAVAVVTQNKINNLNVPQIIVKNVRSEMAQISNRFYNSANKLKIIGVTGTNGKTTTNYMLYKVLSMCGEKVGLIGTNEVIIGNNHIPAKLTTPDPIELHNLFYQMVKEGIEWVVMEVSAHAIALNKLDGIKFKCGIFTNCTQDHLDFFKDMLNYEQTKISFFSSKYCENCVVNSDSETGRIIARTTNIKNCATYGIDNPANCFAINISQSLTKSQFTVNMFDEIENFSLNIGGEHNIYNALACISCLGLLGFEIEKIKSGIEKFKSPSGRFNIIKNNLGATIILDFAHTPDALIKMLKATSPFKKNRIITVFGATGNRDKLKRSSMGQIIESYSDIFFLTSDSPDNENPQDIAAQVLSGVKNKEKVKIILDREECVTESINILEKGDILLVLGKGTEEYQIINGEKVPYNDQKVIENALNKRK